VAGKKGGKKGMVNWGKQTEAWSSFILRGTPSRRLTFASTCEVKSANESRRAGGVGEQRKTKEFQNENENASPRLLQWGASQKKDKKTEEQNFRMSNTSMHHCGIVAIRGGQEGDE